MSTIIIITPPKKDQTARVVPTADGAEIQDGSGFSVATFQSIDQAQAYLRSIKNIEKTAE